MIQPGFGPNVRRSRYSDRGAGHAWATCSQPFDDIRKPIFWFKNLQEAKIDMYLSLNVILF